MIIWETFQKNWEMALPCQPALLQVRGKWPGRSASLGSDPCDVFRTLQYIFRNIHWIFRNLRERFSSNSSRSFGTWKRLWWYPKRARKEKTIIFKESSDGNAWISTEKVCKAGEKYWQSFKRKVNISDRLVENSGNYWKRSSKRWELVNQKKNFPKKGSMLWKHFPRDV